METFATATPCEAGPGDVVETEPRPDQACLRAGGCFSLVDCNGHDIAPRSRKARAIIAFLAVHANSCVSREQLLELLWGDRGETQARDSFRQALHEIRSKCGSLIRTDRDHIYMDGSALRQETCGCDEEIFADLNHITPEFDEWLDAYRQRRARELWTEISRQVESFLDAEQPTAAMPLIEQLELIDPYNDDWVRFAMRAEALAGRPAAIDTEFKRFNERLEREMGLSPAAETRTLHDSLLQETSEFASVESVAGIPIPLPQLKQQPFGGKGWLPLAASVVLAGAAVFVGSGQLSAGGTPTVAVLPFAASSDADSALAEGMSDELTSQLAENDGLRVIGRRSADQFRGKAVDLAAAGRALRAKYLVEGKLAGSPREVRIAVSLVRASDGTLVWARDFAAAPRQLQALQARISTAVGKSLGAAPPPARGFTDGGAYELYVRAKRLMRNRDSVSMTQAVDLLREAIRLDPKFAGAWAQLAMAAQLTGQTDVVIDARGSQFRVSRQAAARRALALDPNSADAHAAAAIVDRVSTANARAHLRRALQLQPGNTQTMLWTANALANTGNYRDAGKLWLRAAALDPMWKRPVAAAAVYSVDRGDNTTAERLLRNIQSSAPDAATDVDIELAFAKGDLSRAVQVALNEDGRTWSSGKATAAGALLNMGFVREATLLAPLSQVERATLRGRAPSLSVLLDDARQSLESGDIWTIALLLYELPREGRWSDVAALYDLNRGAMADLKGTDAGGRAVRLDLGPTLALALYRVGRKPEAIRLAMATNEAANALLANGDVPPHEYVFIAGSRAILGDRKDALRYLEKAFDAGYLADAYHLAPLAEDPVFATLRNEPRFQRLVGLQEARLQRERHETLELDIF